MGDVLVMRIQLTDAHASAPLWPDGVELRPFDPLRHASPARALLNAAYARGGGEVRDVEAWWGEISIDAEFDAALCFAVFEAHTDALIAFAQCWTTGFVKDIAVAADRRGQGLGAALMGAIFNTFHARGAEAVTLKVTLDNPSGAPALYERLGMTRVDA